MYSSKSDPEIQRQVEAELAWDSRLRGKGIGVEVHEGAVTLSGVVDSWARKVAAREAAHRVGGVFEVLDELTVVVGAAARRDDAELAAAVRHALEWDALVPDARIASAVREGMVTLEGTVDTWTEVEDAERAIRNLGGVVHVQNDLTVGGVGRDGDVHDAIEEALLRHVVRGHVGSWAERAAVLGAVRGTRGVARVDDRLSVW